MVLLVTIAYWTPDQMDGQQELYAVVPVPHSGPFDRGWSHLDIIPKRTHLQHVTGRHHARCCLTAFCLHLRSTQRSRMADRA